MSKHLTHHPWLAIVEFNRKPRTPLAQAMVIEIGRFDLADASSGSGMLKWPRIKLTAQDADNRRWPVVCPRVVLAIGRRSCGARRIASRVEQG